MLAVGNPNIASAHVYLERVNPPPGVNASLPPMVELTFSGSLDRGSTVRLLDASGTDVPGVEGGIDPTNRTRLVATLPECPPGAYTVAWVAVSAEDGHAAPGFHGVLVVGATPFLGGDGPVSIGGGVGDLDLALAPAMTAGGGVVWVVQVGGPTAEAVQRVALTFTPPVAELGTVQVTAVLDDAGNRVAAWLPTIVGEWRIDVIVRRTGIADDVRQRFFWTAASPIA
jgi:methionine-rich copper-binding protein CopC